MKVRPARKALLFDIDGTLLLTGGAGLEAFERAFEECFGVAGAWGAVVPDGKTDPIIFGEIARTSLGRDMTPAEYDDLCRRYLEYFPGALMRSERFRVLRGVEALLERLAAAEDLLLGVATGNLEAAAWHKLKRGGLDRFFGFGGFGSDAARRADLVGHAIRRGRERSLPAVLRPGDFVVIGDTPLDVAAAKANGAPCVAVATGSYSARELEASGADLTLEDLSSPEPLFAYLDAS